jgi:(5-formylfuran-3-yl)methyl phosphate synthase
MRLLVSVTDAHEARVAVGGGVDIVDVKNPAEGSLGAPAPGVIERVRSVVPPERPVSAAIGDLPNLPGTAALAALGAARAGAAYVKVGLWGTSTTDEAVAVLGAARDAVDGRATVVAAAYADAERAPGAALPHGALVEAARRAGVGGCLLDTAVKDGRGLFDWIGPEALAAVVAEAHAAGLEVALAGALRPADLDAVRATGADIAGVRAAACRDGRRTEPLDPERIGRLGAVCGHRGAWVSQYDTNRPRWRRNSA